MSKKHKQRSLKGDDVDDSAEGARHEDSRGEPDDEIGFEEAVEELERVVQDLEDGDLPLEEAMQRFERGLVLVRTCQAKLKQAELRVSELLEDGAAKEVEG